MSECVHLLAGCMEKSFDDLVEWRPEWTGEDKEAFEVAKKEGEQRTTLLRDLREKLCLSQVEVAKILATSQSNVSKMERRSDVDIRTFAKIVRAKGGKIRVIAEVGGEVLTFSI